MQIGGIGPRIRQIRNSIGLTQAEAAKIIALSASQFSKAEVGLRNFGDSAIRLLAVKFGANENWIRTGEGEPFAAQQDPSDPLTQRLREPPAALNRAPVRLPGNWPEMLGACVAEKRVAVEAGVNDFKMTVSEALRPALELFERRIEEENKKDGGQK